jgi:hypothetical protein
MWGVGRYLVAATVVALPLALGGCGLGLSLYIDQLERANARPAQRSAEAHPRADRAVTVAGPLAIALGPQSVLTPTDRHHLQEGLAAGLRRRFSQVVVMDAGKAPPPARQSTVLELDTVRDASRAQPAVVHAVVRVYDDTRSLQSVFRSPAVAVDLTAPDRNAAIDELLAGLIARLDTLLLSP